MDRALRAGDGVVHPGKQICELSVVEIRAIAAAQNTAKDGHAFSRDVVVPVAHKVGVVQLTGTLWLADKFGIVGGSVVLICKAIADKVNARVCFYGFETRKRGVQGCNQSRLEVFFAEVSGVQRNTARNLVVCGI